MTTRLARRRPAVRPRRSARRRLALVAVVLLLLGGLAGCSKKGLSAKSSCKDFLAASGDQQTAAIDKIAGQLHAPEAVTPLGRPNVYAICAANSSDTLGFAIQRTG